MNRPKLPLDEDPAPVDPCPVEMWRNLNKNLLNKNNIFCLLISSQVKN